MEGCVIACMCAWMVLWVAPALLVHVNPSLAPSLLRLGPQDGAPSRYALGTLLAIHYNNTTEESTR